MKVLLSTVVCLCVRHLLVIKCLFLSSKSTVLYCFVVLKLGFYQPHFWLPSGSFRGSANRRGQRVTVGPGKEEGTCFFLSASSSHESHLSSTSLPQQLILISSICKTSFIAPLRHCWYLTKPPSQREAHGPWPLSSHCSPALEQLLPLQYMSVFSLFDFSETS